MLLKKETPMQTPSLPVSRAFRLDLTRLSNEQERKGIDGTASTYIRWLNNPQELTPRPFEGDLILLNAEDVRTNDQVAANFLIALKRGARGVVYFNEPGRNEGITFSGTLPGETITGLLDCYCRPISENGQWTTATIDEALEVGLNAINRPTSAVLARFDRLERTGQRHVIEEMAARAAVRDPEWDDDKLSQIKPRAHSRQEILAQALIHCQQIVRFYLAQDLEHGGDKQPLVVDPTDWQLDMAEIANQYRHGELAKAKPEDINGLPQDFYDLLTSLQYNDALGQQGKVLNFLRAARNSGEVENKDWPEELLAAL
jgi:hypothetical protein